MLKNYFIFELNEFNIKLLQYYSKKFNFVNIKKILKFNISKTYTLDRYEGDNNQNGYLDPWTQWVSIHTQKNARSHKIKNLGDIPNLKYKQIWEKNIEKDFYIWGAMNASRRNSKNVKLFFPDPWVYSEKAYPSHLNQILKPIKLLTKSRGRITITKKTKFLLKLFINIIKLSGLKNIFGFIKIILIGITKIGYKPIIFIVAWEYLILNIFLKNIKNKKKFISIFFMNCLAHAQHHYWYKNSKEINFCLTIIDICLKKILGDKKLSPIIISGLSQKNSSQQKLYLYEQYSHNNFLNFINVKFSKVEKLMTNDAYIFFKNKSDTLNCFKILNEASFRKKKIFHVEIKSDYKIFYKMNFLKKVITGDKLKVNNIKINFLSFFKFITLRRGIHDHKGSIISQHKLFPKTIQNHLIFNYIK